MTRKHFNDLAETVKGLRQAHGGYIPADALMNALSRMASRYNERFDWDRFAKACEPDKTAVFRPLNYGV